MSALSANQELEIKELVTKGNKIAAVKLYREITGAGLKESKDAVESIERGVPIRIAENEPTKWVQHGFASPVSGRNG